MDEPSIEVGKAEEGLYVLDIARDRPVEDFLDLLGVHANAVLANDVAKVFDFFGMELAFLGFAEEVVLAKTFEDFSDVPRVIRRVVREDEDVV